MCVKILEFLFTSFAALMLLLSVALFVLSVQQRPRWSTVFRGTLRLCSGSHCVPRPSLLPVRTVYWCGTWTPAPSPPGTSPSVATKTSSIGIPSSFTWRVGLWFSWLHHYHFLYLCFKRSHVKFSTISPSGLAGLHLAVLRFCPIPVTLLSRPSPGLQAALCSCRPRRWTPQWWYQAATSPLTF